MRRRASERDDEGARDRASFERAIGAIAPLDPDDLALGFARMRPRTYARREDFLRAGTGATEVAIVVTGLFREYFLLADGTERTKAFVAEDELTGSLADLIVGGPSRATIVAEEPSRVLVAPHAEFRSLAGISAGWARFSQRALELLLVRKAEREFELLGLDAAARYAGFADRYPGLEARVAARHVASYLGITPVHLSRLRRRRRERARTAATSMRRPRSPRSG